MAEATWQVVAALVDPVRRALYDHVRHERRPVSREDAARALDISRSLAAFHLDKLVEVGMLHARYEAPPEQPRGRGRSPKVYEASSDGLSLTMPPRQYQLMATILADAVAENPHDAAASACRRAIAFGQAIGTSAATAGDPASRAVTCLADLGYEPRPEGDDVVLGNCPFQPIASAHTALVCGINVEFVAGLLSGLGCAGMRAELRPCPDRCCVRLIKQ